MVEPTAGGHDLVARQKAAGVGAPAAHDLAPRDETPFVNLRDPARALGPDGRPAVSRRARADLRTDVPARRTSAGTTGAGSSPTASTRWKKSGAS
jgi:hypothetical protein